MAQRSRATRILFARSTRRASRSGPEREIRRIGEASLHAEL
jgi:hypothetical protein